MTGGIEDAKLRARIHVAEELDLLAFWPDFPFVPDSCYWHSRKAEK